ncbi:Zinc finger protein CONSTANS-LIKE 16-like protein [Drosera capensis]
MILDEKMIASAVGGKTARACDYCVRNRARWYCAPDDAFLCQLCDSSVHSANPLARRHERVRLKTASLKIHGCNSRRSSRDELVPSWHRGLTRRPRTPRQVKQAALSMKRKLSEIRSLNPPPVVPQAGADDDVSSHEDESEEQLLYRVPILDPFAAHLCTPGRSSRSGSDHTAGAAGDSVKSEVASDHVRMRSSDQLEYVNCNNSNGYFLTGFDHVNISELEEFALAADVESLLGGGLDDQEYGMEELGLLDSCGGDQEMEVDKDVGSGRVKDEDQEGIVTTTPATTTANLLCQVEAGVEVDVAREPFELTFHYDSPSTCEEKHVININLQLEEACDLDHGRDQEEGMIKKRKIELSLDYDAISTAWANKGSPWMNGEKPMINLDDCWPQCLGGCGSLGSHSHGYGDHVRGMPGVGQATIGDGGREARVSRYREKRRTRLFSKKIRYEVRKLNAEKRPRMKGRFVKRSSFPAGSGPATTTPAIAAAAAFPLLAK